MYLYYSNSLNNVVYKNLSFYLFFPANEVKIFVKEICVNTVFIAVHKRFYFLACFIRFFTLQIFNLFDFSIFSQSDLLSHNSKLGSRNV